MTFQFWHRWLMVVTAGVIVYGFALMLFPAPMYRVFNQLFFSSEAGMPADKIRDYISLVQGVLGAVLIGWMVTIFAVLVTGFRRKQGSAWATLAISIGVWYVIDSGFSLVIGVVAHALFNTVFLVLFIPPLVATYGEMEKDLG